MLTWCAVLIGFGTARLHPNGGVNIKEIFMILLHIGMPKTGTTFLQTQFFQKNSNILNLFEFRGEGQPGHSEIMSLNKGNEFSPEKLRHEITEHVQNNASRFPILSWEDLSQNKGARFEDKAAALYSAFPDAEVVVTLREPVSYSVSLYTQWLRPMLNENPKRTYLSYADWVSRKAVPPHLYQQTVVKEFERKFKTVRVCLYEEMKADFTSYVRRFWPKLPVSDKELNALHDLSAVHSSLTKDVVDFVGAFRGPEGSPFKKRLAAYKLMARTEIQEKIEEFERGEHSEEADSVVPLYGVLKDTLLSGDRFQPTIPPGALARIVAEASEGLADIDGRHQLRMRDFGYPIG